MATTQVDPEYYSIAWRQYVTLCRAEKRPISGAKEHKCGTSACSWVLTRGLPEDVELYFCSLAGTQHLCGPLACERRSRQNGAEVCRCTGRTLQSMIMSGSAYAADSSGFTVRAGVPSSSAIGDDTAPTGAPPPVPPLLTAAPADADTTAKITDAIVLLLNSEAARQCRRETLEKRQERGVKEVAMTCVAGQKVVGAVNIAIATQRIWIHYLQVFQKMAAPCETAPEALISDLAHNILMMWREFITDTDTSGITNFVSTSRRSHPNIQTFTHVCLTLYCSGFDDTEHGFTIKPSPTLSRFMIQSPIVTRLSAFSGSLVHHLSILKECLHVGGSSLRLITLRDEYGTA